MVRNYKKDMESLWTAKCNIFGYEKSRNQYGGVEFSLVEKETEVPCRISYSRISQVEQRDLPNITQIVKLFLSNSIVIEAGSIIEVEQNGVARKYKHSGVSAVYTNHQEIILDLYDEVA